MSEQSKAQQPMDSNKPHGTAQSMTPENRVLNGTLVSRVRERIRAGYYESGYVLREIAERITGRHR